MLTLTSLFLWLLHNGVVLRFYQGLSKIGASISLDVLHIAIILQLIVMLMMPFLLTKS
jgi:hypothetical protein